MTLTAPIFRQSGSDTMESYQEKARTLAERFGISPAAAMKALEEADGDMLDAVIRLEAEGVINRTSAAYKTEYTAPPPKKRKTDYRETGAKLSGKLTELLSKGMAASLTIRRGGKTLCTMPLLIFLMIFLFAIKLVIIAMIISLFAGCSYHIDMGRNDDMFTQNPSPQNDTDNSGSHR